VERSQRRELTEQMRHSSGSYELVLSPLIFALIAYLIDGWLGTTPILTIMAAVIGLTGAVVKLYLGYGREMDAHDVGAPWAKPTRIRPPEGSSEHG
jgi:F0F1-type ATP synthase assembly protein I